MKIALCQINPTVGAFKENKELILRNYTESLDNGADLVVFPEMSITGYPISDLLYEDGFIDQNMTILDEIISNSTKPLIIGYVHQKEGKLFNSAAVCLDGKLLFRYDKILLPTYDVFDEERYFSPGKELGLFEIDINNKQMVIGLQICEDLWDHEYDRKISDELSKSGASYIINISASPYHGLKF
ncbi:MAG: nitrilase-related carbon-nitrogen hydrolase, partial [Candidatus Marinimicrobia bacterium]|nr:nitrilase-related carbon-nitrogen hydrolase [Candidatus Neomarinimicrobiota bacterium]